MVSTKDIGVFGAMAMNEPDVYLGRAVVLAGDEFDMPTMQSTYKEVGRFHIVLPKDQSLIPCSVDHGQGS